MIEDISYELIAVVLFCDYSKYELRKDVDNECQGIKRNNATLNLTNIRKRKKCVLVLVH